MEVEEFGIPPLQFSEIAQYAYNVTSSYFGIAIMTGETTVHHSMTDSQGKYIESIQGVVYRREHKMLTLRKRYSARTTNSHHRFYKYNNIIKDIEVKRYNQVWVSDITYIRTVKGFCYLALITDMHSRKIVGYYLKVIALS